MTDTTDRPRRIVPVDDDHDTGGFWDAAKRGQLVVRRCDGCGAVLNVPVAYCHACGSCGTPIRPIGK